MYHIFSIHSSFDGHLGCFHVPTIVNSAAINIGVYMSFFFFFKFYFIFKLYITVLDLPNIKMNLLQVYMSFWIVVFSEYMPSIRTAQSYGSFISSLLRNLHTVLQSGCINLHWYSHCIFFYSHCILKKLFITYFRYFTFFSSPFCFPHCIPQ